MGQERTSRTQQERLTIGLVGPLPQPAGGMANQTEQLARLLDASGVGVEVVRTNAPYRPGVVAHLRGVRALFRLAPYLLALWRAAGRVDLFHVMANSGWAWHLFATPAIWVARLRGIPVIVNYRGGEAGRFLERQHRWIRPTLRRATAVVVPSGFLREVFAQWDVPTETVPNIIDLARFAPGPSQAGRLHFLVARNLEDIYDIPTAIHAFAQIRRLHAHARLTVAGSGPRRADLEALCASLGLHDAVTFAGRLDNQQMAQLYRVTDFVLNPTTADNMPISLLEAMASETPIVTTDAGGIPFLVEHERTALLVPVGDARAMSAAALRLIDDPALAARLRAAGQRTAAGYTWARVRPRLLDVYARALGRTELAIPSL